MKYLPRTRRIPPPPVLGPAHGANPPPALPLTLQLPIDDEGYDTDISDIWAVDDRYNIWGLENNDHLDSVESVIDITESLEVIKISSDEDS